jgi:hypothetical protein
MISEYTGASLIPIIEYNNELCLVLFGDTKHNIYMDLGGHAEINELPNHTASRESTEESLNTFNIRSDQFTTDFIEYNNYICYFKKIKIEFSEIKEIYSYNKKILEYYKLKQLVPTVWNETKNITIFSINSLLNGFTINHHEYACTDIFGSLKIVFRRPIKYLKNAIKKNYFYYENNKWNSQLITHKPYINFHDYSSFLFLTQTKSILI